MTTKGITLSLSADALDEALRDAVAKGIGEGIGSWDIRSAIKDAAQKEIERLDLPGLVAKRLRSLLNEDAAGIADRVSSGLLAGVERAMEQAGNAAAVGMLYGLMAGKQTYGDDAKLWKKAERMVQGEPSDA